MEQRTDVDLIIVLTHDKLDAWKSHNGYAPSEESSKLNNMMFDWILSLTDTLKLWEEKGILMSDGELILACANLGSLVESMMKFVLSVYVLDYYRDPIRNDKGKIVEPEKLKFETLKQFCFTKVWSDSRSIFLDKSVAEIKA